MTIFAATRQSSWQQFCLYSYHIYLPYTTKHSKATFSDFSHIYLLGVETMRKSLWRQQTAVDYVIYFDIPIRNLTRRRNAISIFAAYLICWYVWWSVIVTISIRHKVGWFWTDNGMITERRGWGHWIQGEIGSSYTIHTRLYGNDVVSDRHQKHTYSADTEEYYMQNYIYHRKIRCIFYWEKFSFWKTKVAMSNPSLPCNYFTYGLYPSICQSSLSS